MVRRGAASGRRRRPVGDPWAAPVFRPRLSAEDLALLREVAEHGDTPQRALRRAIRLAAGRAELLRRLGALEETLGRRLDHLDAKLDGLAKSATSSPPPPPAGSPPDAAVRAAAAAILRFAGDEDA